jgi:diguanylate cyclase (GGDEF)-like protein
VRNEQDNENKKLRRQLKAFVAQARENEAKLQRFNEQELQLISATTLPELVQLILHHYPQTFRLDCISLVLFDPEYELTRMMENSGLSLETTQGLLIETDPGALQPFFDAEPFPRLGPFIDEVHTQLFPPQPRPIRSCALLPLIRRGELIGSLNMGSYSVERFIPGSGTDFLERLAAIVAVCIENCANRQRLKQLGLTDPLTRVNNRRYFDQRLSEEVAAVQRRGTPLSCMFLDIDHFKQVNDTLGHQSGDQVLQEVALLINTQLRHSDILSRYGGEEFVVLLPDTADAVGREIAERIRSSIEQHRFKVSDSRVLDISISIGLACLDAHVTDMEMTLAAQALVAGADQAVYRAKEEGRNRVCLSPIRTASPDCAVSSATTDH